MQANEITHILDYLEIGEYQEIAELSHRVHQLDLDNSHLNDIVACIQEKLDTDYIDPYFEKFPIYLFLLACASHLSGSPDAIKYSERAESQFKVQGKIWNHFISSWLSCIILLNQGHLDRAIEKTRYAITVLTPSANAQSKQGLYNHWYPCEDVLRQLKQLQKEIIDKSTQPDANNNSNPKKDSSKQPSSSGLEAFLYLPQMPIFKHVQAGADGPIWAAPSDGNTYAETDQIIIEDKRYIIFSVNRNDRRVTIDPDRQYGWALVAGNSMNRTLPTNIEPGNMVLFHHCNDAPENAIVIVSCPISGAGFSFMVKRWNRAKQEFLSDSSEKGHPPFPCDNECRIIGIVTAVAKPSQP